jgi:Phage capsid protein
MSIYIPVHFVQSYSTNVQMLLQAKGGKLNPYVEMGTYVGALASPVDQVGAVKAQRKVTRHADTPLISTPGDRRWVEPIDWEWADLIDQQDRLRLLIDPQSAYTLNGVMALRRAQDDVILGAFFATAKTGQNAGSTEAFNTGFTTAGGNVVNVTTGSSGNCGLNVAKMRAVKKTFMKNFVDFDTDRVCLMVTAEEHDDLLAEVQVINLDYNDKPVLVQGKVERFLGIDIVPLEFTNGTFYDSSASLINGTINFCPAWVTSGVHLGIWNDVVTRVDERPDKSYATQVYVKGTYGATRKELKKVLRVDCDSA